MGLFAGRGCMVGRKIPPPGTQEGKRHYLHTPCKAKQAGRQEGRSHYLHTQPGKCTKLNGR